MERMGGSDQGAREIVSSKMSTVSRSHRPFRRPIPWRRASNTTAARVFDGSCLRRLALLCLTLLVMSCVRSTPEDRRRADLIGRDPLFHTALHGVRFTNPGVATVAGAGPGAGTTWTEADRFGTIEGDAREVLIEAANTARRLGWMILGASCPSPGTYIVGGWKQFDRFVADLRMSWSDKTHQFSLVAQTPPVHGGMATNSSPAVRSEVDLSQTCLARATATKA
jgi:hypothetical protein